MTAAVVGLVASYAVLATLLLSLNLRSAWRWPVKAAAITVTTGFFAVVFLALAGHAGLAHRGCFHPRSFSSMPP